MERIRSQELFLPISPCWLLYWSLGVPPWTCSDSKEKNWAVDDQEAALGLSAISSKFFPS